MKLFMLLAVPPVVFAAALVGTALLMPRGSTSGPHTHVQAYYSLSLMHANVVDYEPGGQLKFRGVYYYWCGDLKAVVWFNSSNALISDERYDDGKSSYSWPIEIDRGDGVMVPNTGPAITRHESVTSINGNVNHELREWKDGSTLIYKEERWGYTGLILILIPGLAGLASLVLVWLVSRRRRAREPEIPKLNLEWR